MQEVSEAPLGETEPIPWSDIKISYAYLPCGFERVLGFLVRMLVELVAKGNPAESEGKPGLYICCARFGMVRLLSFQFGLNY